MDKIKRLTPYLLGALIALDLVLVMLNKSTYDSGDSILHFLQSKQALSYPRYFMDHWAKPLFVLLSCGFSHFGWWGMKLFNSLCILLSTYYAALLFKKYGLPQWFAILLCFSAPAFFLVQSSGLTEPLFTLFLTASVYYLHTDNNRLAGGILSFLPFVRSEGLDNYTDRLGVFIN